VVNARNAFSKVTISFKIEIPLFILRGTTSENGSSLPAGRSGAAGSFPGKKNFVEYRVLRGMTYRL